jgi:starvation-inducible outer membrane lipoprotein
MNQTEKANYSNNTERVTAAINERKKGLRKKREIKSRPVPSAGRPEIGHPVKRRTCARKKATSETGNRCWSGIGAEHSG